MPRSGSTAPDAEGWVRVGSMHDLSRDGRVRVQSGGKDVILVMCDRQVYACDNTCAHQHYAMLHSGTLSGCLVTCPMHGWTFDVRTGRSTTGEGRIATYAVRVRGDDVFIRSGA